MSALAEAMRTGGLANLEHLGLRKILVSEEGMEHFASVIQSGALGRLRTLHIFGNPGDSASVQAACKTRRIECFA